MIKDKFIEIALDKVATANNTTSEEVEKVIDAMYKLVRSKIVILDYKNMTLEEFRQAKKSFNIPGLGKLYPSESTFIKINKLNKDGEKI
jgi:hypothetical protein